MNPADEGVPYLNTVNQEVPVVDSGSLSEPAMLIAKVGANIVNTLFYIAGILVIIYMIYNGIIMITSLGDSNRVTAAKQKFINSIIGIIIITLSLVIVQLVKEAYTL